MLKRILIALEEYDYSKTALNYAVRLAPGHDCHLTGLSILDISSIEKSVGPIPIGGTYYAQKEGKLRTEEEQKLAEKLIQEFEQQCQERKIPFQIITRAGSPEDIIIDESKYHDLLIMGQKSSFRYGDEKDKDLQHIVMSQGICPVLIIPETYRDINRILLCYDGYNQSTKAIHQFMQLKIYGGSKFILFHVNDDPAIGEKLLTPMSEYLKIWDISFEQACLSGHPKDVILNYVIENDIDLLVLGAYGYQGILKFFFGSTTEKLIGKGERPVFIYH